MHLPLVDEMSACLIQIGSRHCRGRHFLAGLLGSCIGLGEQKLPGDKGRVASARDSALVAPRAFGPAAFLFAGGVEAKEVAELFFEITALDYDFRRQVEALLMLFARRVRGRQLSSSASVSICTFVLVKQVN